jgi:hypothetical protein
VTLPHFVLAVKAALEVYNCVFSTMQPETAVIQSILEPKHMGKYTENTLSLLNDQPQ